MANHSDVYTVPEVHPTREALYVQRCQSNVYSVPDMHPIPESLYAQPGTPAEKRSQKQRSRNNTDGEIWQGQQSVERTGEGDHSDWVGRPPMAPRRPRSTLAVVAGGVVQDSMYYGAPSPRASSCGASLEELSTEQSLRLRLVFNPRDAKAMYELSRLLGDEGRDQEAEDIYRQALAIHPENPQGIPRVLRSETLSRTSID